jgi:hypothetical protein
MLTGFLHQHAEQAAARYGIMLTAFRGLFAGASTDTWSMSRRDQVVTQAYAVGRDYLEDEARHIEQATFEIALRAREIAGNSLGASLMQPESDPALSEHLGAFSGYLRDEIAAQVERDIVTLKRELQRLALETDREARLRGITYENALARRRAGGIDPQFHFRDRGGRRLKSQKHIRTIWRHHLLTTYNEVMLFTLAEFGRRKARIEHPDPKHRHAGTVFEIGDEYLALRDEVFHPNSDAVVAPG